MALPLNFSERVSQLEVLITRLIEANQEVPVVVEGQKDAKCLTELGLKGAILKVHTGKTFYEFCDDLSKRYDRVILLMDWDQKGEQIHTQLAEYLEADWIPYDSFRQGLKHLCHPDIHEVEHLARHLRALKNLQKLPRDEDIECS
jgi:5S rRNA maturation endonuclease (ribonuclease M5)